MVHLCYTGTGALILRLRSNKAEKKKKKKKKKKSEFVACEQKYHGKLDSKRRQVYQEHKPSVDVIIYIFFGYRITFFSSQAEHSPI